MGTAWVDSVGSGALRVAARVRFTAVAVAAAAVAAVLPRTWRSSLVRRAFARQVVSIGVEGMPLTAAAALLTGVLVVLQTEAWLRRAGQTQLFGAVVSVIVIREVGPLLTNLLVIARNGSAMVVELGNMSLAGEVAVLDALGVDRFGFLVVPRAVAMAASTFCLTVVFVGLTLASSFVIGTSLGYAPGRPAGFVFDVVDAVTAADALNLAVKSIVPGLVTGTISCVGALAAAPGPGGLSRAAALAVQRSTFALFAVAAITSAFTYG